MDFSKPRHCPDGSLECRDSPCRRRCVCKCQLNLCTAQSTEVQALPRETEPPVFRRWQCQTFPTAPMLGATSCCSLCEVCRLERTLFCALSSVEPDILCCNKLASCNVRKPKGAQCYASCKRCKCTDQRIDLVLLKEEGPRIVHRAFNDPVRPSENQFFHGLSASRRA